MKAEEVRVGGYQILTALLLSVNLITVAMSHALSIFYKYTPKFYCQEESGGASTDVSNVSNRTYGCLPAGVSCAGGYLFESQQHFLLHGSSSMMMMMSPSPERSSVVTEWQLVCERAHLLRALSELYFAGLLLGGLVAGFLADRLGRLPVLAVCLYAQGALAVALNIVEKYQLFLVFRGLQGFFMQGLESCTFILCMELFPAKYRTLVALVVLSIRSLGLMLISGFSYFIPDWRILQLISCVPTAITVLYIWLIPESPRWLIAKGKTIDAQLLLERMSKYNSLLGLSDRKTRSDGKETPLKPKRKAKTTTTTTTTRVTSDDAKCADLEKSLHESLNLLSTAEQERADEEASRAPTIVVTDDKSRPRGGDKSDEPIPPLGGYSPVTSRETTPRQGSRSGMAGFLRRFIGRTCVLLMFAWFASSIAFHSLVSMPQKLSSERHVSLSLAAAMEIGTFVLSYLLATSRCGRRWGLSIGQILAGAVCVAIAVISFNADDRSPLKWLATAKLAAIVIGRIVNIVSFFILRLVMIELLPTTSRATGVGLCIGAEMMGGLLMPFILKLNRFVPELGRVVIGVTCICSGLLVLSLPETLRAVLPDTAEEARELVGSIGDGKDDDEKAKRHTNNFQEHSTDLDTEAS
ncbi:solute carrier family 22 member 15-like [Copidosoma floridanum]|uniref:solute carrier family 22 member 15-like n=1 Tax=Copidosoma floridanum TaxID=29053 RepID=UPI0006C9703F|nr:solute carrier family 22 member 15-like [Copidosoma floridanum]